VAQADLLKDVLELAGREKALEGDALVAFASALRERARLVLAERIAPLEERIRALEAHGRAVDEENAWRREVMEGLERSVKALEADNAFRREAVEGLERSVRALEVDNAFRREELDRAVQSHEAERAWRAAAMEGLQHSVSTLEAENAWRRETTEGLERSVHGLGVELAALAADHGRATAAHDELRAHHRAVVRQVITEVLAVAALPFVRWGQARKRLASLARLLAPEAP